MIAYASRTGTRKNLAFLRSSGWRIMISAKGVLRTEGFPYALDNGAWNAYANGTPFDSDAFLRALDELGECADFIVLPDIVAGGRRSLDFSLSWLDRVRVFGRLMLLPVQDGMSVQMVDTAIAEGMGIFVGGTTEFKEKSLPDWGSFANMFGIYIHCGRVNSRRRLKLCKQAGVDSFDGSGPSRFLAHARVMDAELRQTIFAIG
jgi:hypothetical protein